MSGEDGLLQYILSCLPEQDHWCVEFGAWDGVHLSNTYHLISKACYNGVLIEGDENKYDVLKQNMSRWPETICIKKFVGLDETNRLDYILAETPLKKDLDLLSIDIDGDDYHVWNSLNNYRPKVVIIELGVYYKPGVLQVNEVGSDFVFGVSGTSISSMTKLAERKGYRLICCIGCNAVYVRSEFYDIFHSNDVTQEELFCYDTLPFGRLTFSEKLRKLKLISMRPKLAVLKLTARSLLPRREHHDKCND